MLTDSTSVATFLINVSQHAQPEFRKKKKEIEIPNIWRGAQRSTCKYQIQYLGAIIFNHFIGRLEANIENINSISPDDILRKKKNTKKAEGPTHQKRD